VSHLLFALPVLEQEQVRRDTTGHPVGALEHRFNASVFGDVTGRPCRGSGMGDGGGFRLVHVCVCANERGSERDQDWGVRYLRPVMVSVDGTKLVHRVTVI